jgi:hypothetical protein
MEEINIALKQLTRIPVKIGDVKGDKAQQLLTAERGCEYIAALHTSIKNLVWLLQKMLVNEENMARHIRDQRMAEDLRHKY